MAKEKGRILNEKIRASRVQLILESGENLGEMSINDARIRSKEASLDLMEMSSKGNFSIVKMLDYGKFLYKKNKQEKKNKVAGKTPDFKTLRITFKISEHDLQVKVNQAIKFSKNGHPLKVTLMLRGRENHYTDIARDKMNVFIQKLEELYKLEGRVNKSGNVFSAILKIIK